MDRKAEFEKERLAYDGPVWHIAEESDDKALCETDSLYGAADALSLKNANKLRRILLMLSFAGTLLTMLFLLYDEAELYGLILACGVMILCLFFLRLISDRSECHRKYLEYRVLAESLRAQYFLFLAGIKTRVKELAPWTIKQDIPWAMDILSSLPEPATNKKRSVADLWIKDQKDYHIRKLKVCEKKSRRDSAVGKATVTVTIASYLAALVFEILVMNGALGGIDVNTCRAVLKIVLGTMSALTLFTGNYYGKMSLSNVIDDHRRMIKLFETVENEIKLNGETEELLVSLARECLNENSTWYAYQTKNTPDLVM